MQNAILIDFAMPREWEFRDELEAASAMPWEVISLQSNQNHGKLQDLLRYAKYFWLPFCVFVRRKQYRKVLAWQQFFGLILGFYLRAFRVKHGPEISVMTFIYKPKGRLLGKLYHAFVRYSIQCRHIKHIFVYSESERQHYSELFGVPQSLFQAIKLGVEDEKVALQDSLADKGYYVSAGRSNRDYTFLTEAWKAETRSLKIICDTGEMESTDQIECLHDCHGDDYLKELAGCHGVIIALQDENISSGQLVLLHAMMLGKPVIITKNNALQEYVLDGQTGLVIEKTAAALKEALEALDDTPRYEKMSAGARNHYERNYTYKQLGKSVGTILAAQ